jgi:hypothetical protein
MALVALAVLIWKTLNAELARLSQAPLGKDPHEEFAARFGTRTVGRKRPYGAGMDKEASLFVSLSSMRRELTFLCHPYRLQAISA